MEEKLSEFFALWGKKILYGLSSVFLLSIAVYRFFFSAGESSNAYLDAKVSLEKMKLQRSDTSNEVATHLKEVLSSNSNIKASLSGAVGQEFAITGQWNEAEPFILAALNNSFKEDSPFKLYTETSLLIANQKYEEALKNALALEESIKEEPSKEIKLLYGYNLLRIISLEDFLKLNNEKSLEMWRQFASKTENSEIVAMMSAAFQVGNCCLNDLIDARKNDKT